MFVMNLIIFLRAIPILIISLSIYPFIRHTPRVQLLKEDFIPWAIWQSYSTDLFGFAKLFIAFKEFRNVVYKRLGPIMTPISWLYHRQTNLTIACDNIGPGLRIQHGYSTVICAESIGKNFHVNQCVNIVWNGNARPYIGNNVHVYAGATIVGGVQIADNVTIGAGAVVIKDVPPNSLCVGNPARILPLNK